MPRENNGPYLKKNDYGVFEIRFTERGRSKRRSTGTTDPHLAGKVLANFILLEDRDQRIAAQADGGPMMVTECIGDPDIPGKDYWHEHVVPNVAAKERAGYNRAKLIAHFGHLAVCDIGPDDVQDYVDRRSTKPRTMWTDAAQKLGPLGRPSCPHTISTELATLNAAINHAVKKKRLPKEHAPFIELPGTSQPRDRWLTEDEADRLLAAAAVPQIRQRDKKKLPRVYVFIALALNTASRRCALLEMTWDQVDFDHGLIYLNPEGRKQTKKRRPTVPISNELRPILERARSERVNDFVLGFDNGSIRTAFDNAVERAGLKATGKEKVTPHVLRHTWATWSALGAQDMGAFINMAAVMGDRLETVLRTYAHHMPEHLRAAVNNVRPSSRAKPELRIVA
jgi:integrase